MVLKSKWGERKLLSFSKIQPLQHMTKPAQQRQHGFQ